MPSVVLVTMPWSSLFNPSIQIGILQRILTDSGIPTEARVYNLEFMEYLAAQTLSDGSKIKVEDYMTIGVDFCMRGLGEWIFSVPPFRERNPSDDQQYFDYLRTSSAAETVLVKAAQMRQLIPQFLVNCSEDLLQAAPAVVGFTTGFSQTIPSLVLAKLLKWRNPQLRIVFGGVDCDGPMGAALIRAFPWIDVVVRGEAELVLPELAEDLLCGQSIRPRAGLCFREGGSLTCIDRIESGKVSMDRVPTPNYDEYFSRLNQSPLLAQILPSLEITFETSRGCWWGEKSHCTFCGFNGFDMAFRSKSPERVIGELLELAGKYRWLGFMATDAIIDTKYFRSFLPLLREQGFDFQIFYETKANLNKEQVRLMQEAGIKHIQPGIESLSTPILRLMKKGATGLQNIRLLKWCTQFKIDALWNLIYGFPNEPPEEYARMADLIKSLTHLQPPTLVPLVLDRFSPYQRAPEEHGLQITGPPDYYPYVFPRETAVVNEFLELAYRFEFRHQDGRDPEAYIGPVRQIIQEWHRDYLSDRNRLSYLRGPNFLTVTDERSHFPSARYTLEGIDAKIYLMCESGNAPRKIRRELEAAGTLVTGKEICDLLGELVELRLVYQEEGLYLALAIPEIPERQSVPASEPLCDPLPTSRRTLRVI